MVSILSGFIGGLVATIVMTVFMMMLGDDSPPPTAQFWAKFVGDGDPAQYMRQGMMLHILYGIIAGAVFVILIPILGIGVAGFGAGILWGLVYGIVLFIIAAAFWMMMVLGMQPEMKMAGMFLFFHFVYGIVLGAWIGLGILS